MVRPEMVSNDPYRVTTRLLNGEHPTPDQVQGSSSLAFQSDSLESGSSKIALLNASSADTAQRKNTAAINQPPKNSRRINIYS